MTCSRSQKCTLLQCGIDRARICSRPWMLFSHLSSVSELRSCLLFVLSLQVTALLDQSRELSGCLPYIFYLRVSISRL
ncbi:hypothetical protein CC2G_002155 [Coprinopsis cinerea AmutBmut pab1-1]|nr:hypothetical protein CC2G_002155 [Coprinopsis cinerea AmutBmut pab1-1]